MTSTDQRGSHAEAPTTGKLSKPWQWVVLVFVCGHLLAVFAEPFHFFSRSPVQSGADAEMLRNVSRPYAQFMFLDHGYFFFAPNPGPGHLLRIVHDDSPVPPPSERFGVNPYDGILFPDRNRHKPRLLYHRYLMFADFVNNRFAPPQLEEELAREPLIVKSWTHDRSIYVGLIRSISDHVKRETDKPFVRVDRLEREIPDRLSTLQQKIRISDPRWIQILPESLSQFSEQDPRLKPNKSDANQEMSPPFDQREELMVPK